MTHFVQRWQAAFLAACFLFGLTSCRRTSQVVLPAHSVEKHSLVPTVHDVERGLVDISLPLGALVREWVQSGDCHIVVCESMQSLQELINFYAIDNEQLGWHVITQCMTEQHAFMVSEKPRRVCVVAIHAERGRSMVEIHVGNRITLFDERAIC